MTPTEAIEYMRNVATNLPRDLQQCCEKVLDDPRFATWTASKGWHHAYEGGLAVHTAEVLRGALAMQRGYHQADPAGYHQADPAILITACIFHDYEKIRDYIPCDVTPKTPFGWDTTKYHDQIRHIAGGYAYWRLTATEFGVPPSIQDEVGHCLLAHHGRPEYGSPIAPQTPEAYILNCADSLSAFYGEDARR